ncbi:MAG TPA: 3'-5' exonuclease [Caulobacteraceae bacterium]
MQDVMVDLETLGNSAGCVVISIGAVAFDPATGEIDDGFYTSVNVRSSIVHGLRFDQDTLNWWDKQSAEAREALTAAYKADSPRIVAALGATGAYLRRWGGADRVRVWGNGSDFDNSILTACYRAIGENAPWAFWNSRCFRTLKNLHPEIAAPERKGVHHNALDDAKHQAEHALMIFAARKQPAKLFDFSKLTLPAVKEDDLIG